MTKIVENWKGHAKEIVQYEFRCQDRLGDNDLFCQRRF